MDVELLIDGERPKPRLGIMRAYIEEGINRVTLVELLTISDTELTEEDIETHIGKPATLRLFAPVSGSLQASRFDGTIYEFHEPNPYRVEKDRFMYRIIIRPKVWVMSIGNNSRSFPNKSRIEVIQSLLEEYKLVKGQHFDTFYYKTDVYPKLAQILQTEVSDWTFIRRLMTEAGINFYFGAKKDGDTEEMMRLVDHNIYFPDGCSEKIPWRPASQETDARHIETFETQVRTVPSTVSATALFGDGMVRTFSAQESLSKGKGSKYAHFCAGGQDEQVAKRSAKVLSQCFETQRVTYEGASNHFLIRAGERFQIDGPTSAKQKKVLMTTVRHYLKQEADAAFGDTGKMHYANEFTAVRAESEVRPQPQITVVDARAGTSRATTDDMRSSPDSAAAAATSATPPTAGDEGYHQLLLAIERLMAASAGFGVMLGTVAEDATVSEGNEMTCRIENERFPDGLVVKVAAPWLVPGGGITALPRVGMQVYFMLVQGEGGGHEGVMLGYRSSGEVPGLNPAKQTETPILKPGPKPELDKPAKPVVEKASVKPSNRQRNALAGEGGVCEMAVIDGADATMALTAQNTISLSAQSDTNISSKNHMHMADVANQQFGELTTGVSGDYTESINGNHQFSLQGNQEMFVAGNISRTVSGNIEESVSGNKTGTVDGNLENTIAGNCTWTISGDKSGNVSGNQDATVSGNRTATISGNDETSVTGDMTTTISGNGTIAVTGNQTIAADSNIEMGCTDFTLSSNGTVSITGASKVELVCGAGSLSIDSSGTVAVNGMKVDITGTGGPVGITGTMVKLNA